MADEKANRAIVAAAEVFLRYGYARTTMGDIAKASSMSRPALYLLFPGKEQLFAAATMHLAKQQLETIRQALETCRGLEQKLVTACEILLVSIFELQQSNPDARDMDDLGFAVVREIYVKFENFLAEIVADGITHSSASPAEFARVLLYGLRGLREVAQSADDFRAMIRLHIAMLCRAGLRSGA